MKITVIRHGKVNMKWPKKCSSDDFDKACAEYDRSDLENRNDTIQRANKAIDLCENANGDCILVTHGFFMKL